MVLRLGYDIRFEIPAPVAMVALLHVHPSRAADLRAPDEICIEPWTPVETFLDSFRESLHSICRAAGRPPIEQFDAARGCGFRRRGELQRARSSRAAIASSSSGLPAEQPLLRGGPLCADCHGTVRRDRAGMGKGAGDLRLGALECHLRISVRPPHEDRAWMCYAERSGVCRDFQHLAVTLCRALNIPARYASGYLGDIRVPAAPSPMDFSAWFEVYLEDRWWTFDARHNQPRLAAS